MNISGQRLPFVCQSTEHGRTVLLSRDGISGQRPALNIPRTWPPFVKDMSMMMKQDFLWWYLCKVLRSPLKIPVLWVVVGMWLCTTNWSDMLVYYKFRAKRLRRNLYCLNSLFHGKNGYDITGMSLNILHLRHNKFCKIVDSQCFIELLLLIKRRRNTLCKFIWRKKKSIFDVQRWKQSK